MIIIRLMGGLGNQLFQYAYGKALSNEKREVFAIDASWYKGRMNRTYMLDHFNIKARQASWFRIFLTKIFSPNKYLEDPLGDWHKEKYSQSVADEIRKEFTLSSPLSSANIEILKQIEATDSVSLHLRGGDYIKGNKSHFHTTCSPEYYNEAVKIIREKISNPHFFIFTDDIAWAETHITFPEPYTLVSKPSNPAYEELILMSSCKHSITANSTFSWWAAWLAVTQDQKSRIVITPKKWFNDPAFTTDQLLPSNWIQL